MTSRRVCPLVEQGSRDEAGMIIIPRDASFLWDENACRMESRKKKERKKEKFFLSKCKRFDLLSLYKFTSFEFIQAWIKGNKDSFLTGIRLYIVFICFRIGSRSSMIYLCNKRTRFAPLGKYYAGAAPFKANGEALLAHWQPFPAAANFQWVIHDQW